MYHNTMHPRMKVRIIATKKNYNSKKNNSILSQVIVQTTPCQVFEFNHAVIRARQRNIIDFLNNISSLENKHDSMQKPATTASSTPTDASTADAATPTTTAQYIYYNTFYAAKHCQSIIFKSDSSRCCRGTRSTKEIHISFSECAKHR